MNIRSINIEQYRHLENLNFDFTYPDGHEKAGKPLEKICLIGQSATGKTGILELVKTSLKELKNAAIINGRHLSSSFHLPMTGVLNADYEGIDVRLSETGIDFGDKTFKKAAVGGSFIELDLKSMRLLYIGADVISPKSIAVFSENPLDVLNSSNDSPSANREQESDDFSYIWEFSEEMERTRWAELLADYLDYRKRFTQLASELINKGTFVDFTKSQKRYEEWSATNKNPLIPFADFFNPLLNKLALEIDLVNTEYTIPIKSLVTDHVIPIGKLSTGTKGLLLSMLPVFVLETKGAILLIDEPERSLFPDIQMEVVDYYRKSARDAQLIVATHSPFIAAAFEPEERFILYFNDGKVCVRRGSSPIGDDPNDILKNDFQVDYYNAEGHRAYNEYLSLKQQVRAEKDPAKKKELLVDLVTLGDKYNFNEARA